jgi:hypothetical protein
LISFNLVLAGRDQMQFDHDLAEFHHAHRRRGRSAAVRGTGAG